MRERERDRERETEREFKYRITQLKFDKLTNEIIFYRHKNFFKNCTTCFIGHLSINKHSHTLSVIPYLLNQHVIEKRIPYYNLFTTAFSA